MVGHKFGKITTNLDLIISRFNQVGGGGEGRSGGGGGGRGEEQGGGEGRSGGGRILLVWQQSLLHITMQAGPVNVPKMYFQIQYWVVTEIVREPDLVKRVALVKKFIKIAG